MKVPNFRLIKDYKEFQKNKPLGVVGGPIDEQNLNEWEVTIPGPEESPFEGGNFKVKICLPEDFPNSPPQCCFLTKVFHPNINFKTGSICVNFLKKTSFFFDKMNNKKTWTNRTTICDVIVGLYALLKFPNQDDPLNSNARDLFVRDKERYEQLAKSFTNKFAKIN